jgi:hypothetical protein
MRESILPVSIAILPPTIFGTEAMRDRAGRKRGDDTEFYLGIIWTRNGRAV